jgi:hypothetical protein
MEANETEVMRREYETEAMMRAKHHHFKDSTPLAPHSALSRLQGDIYVQGDIYGILFGRLLYHSIFPRFGSIISWNQWNQ